MLPRLLVLSFVWGGGCAAGKLVVKTTEESIFLGFTQPDLSPDSSSASTDFGTLRTSVATTQMPGGTTARKTSRTTKSSKGEFDIRVKIPGIDDLEGAVCTMCKNSVKQLRCGVSEGVDGVINSMVDQLVQAECGQLVLNMLVKRCKKIIEGMVEPLEEPLKQALQDKTAGEIDENEICTTAKLC